VPCKALTESRPILVHLRLFRKQPLPTTTGGVRPTIPRRPSTTAAQLTRLSYNGQARLTCVFMPLLQPTRWLRGHRAPRRDLRRVFSPVNSFPPLFPPSGYPLPTPYRETLHSWPATLDRRISATRQDVAEALTSPTRRRRQSIEHEPGPVGLVVLPWKHVLKQPTTPRRAAGAGVVTRLPTRGGVVLRQHRSATSAGGRILRVETLRISAPPTQRNAGQDQINCFHPEFVAGLTSAPALPPARPTPQSVGVFLSCSQDAAAREN